MVFFLFTLSLATSLILFRFKTPEHNRPIVHAGYISEKLKELVNKK
jgi:hypothetical protein